jgi:hypothetical protein
MFSHGGVGLLFSPDTWIRICYSFHELIGPEGGLSLLGRSRPPFEGAMGQGGSLPRKRVCIVEYPVYPESREAGACLQEL